MSSRLSYGLVFLLSHVINPPSWTSPHYSSSRRVANRLSINSGYTLYTTEIAGITPCYSPLSSTLNATPPPGLTLDPVTFPANTNTFLSTEALIPSTTLSTTSSAPPTSTQIFNNVYLATPFPVQPPPSEPAVSKGDTAAIILASLGGLSILASWFLWRRRRGSSSFEKYGYTIAWIAPLKNRLGKNPGSGIDLGLVPGSPGIDPRPILDRS